jgi:hypothetical protein
MRMGWKIDQLEKFELFYRGLGLLGSGFRITPEDRELVGATGESEELVQSRWLQRIVHQKDEMDLLGEIDGSNVLQWWREDYDPGPLLEALTTISRGSFAPADLVRENHDLGHYRYFSEFRCTISGTRHWLYLPDEKYLSDNLFAELNRWIAHTGRQFANVGHWGPNGEPLFACISADEAETLADRGVTARFIDTWETHPRELLPLAEHFWALGAYARLHDITSFNVALCDGEPQLHLFRALASKALGDEAGAWQAIAMAHVGGIKDAAEQLEAWQPS